MLFTFLQKQIHFHLLALFAFVVTPTSFLHLWEWPLLATPFLPTGHACLHHALFWAVVMLSVYHFPSQLLGLPTSVKAWCSHVPWLRLISFFSRCLLPCLSRVSVSVALSGQRGFWVPTLAIFAATMCCVLAHNHRPNCGIKNVKLWHWFKTSWLDVAWVSYVKMLMWG